MSDAAEFVPALGHKGLTWAYDIAIALLARESTWRRSLVAAVAAGPNDVILDVGCGTGSLAIMIKRGCPQARLIGIDPDPDVLRIARRKANAAGVAVEWVQGGADRIPDIVDKGEPTKVVSSLVFHHLSLPTKRAAFEAIFGVLRPGGHLVMADYGLQRTWLMRALFRLVHNLDGFEPTQPNADGILPRLIREAGFHGVTELSAVPTATGSISLYESRRP